VTLESCHEDAPAERYRTLEENVARWARLEAGPGEHAPGGVRHVVTLVA